MMESMLDHVAQSLGLDHLEVREVNLMSENQTTAAGVVMEHQMMARVLGQLVEEARSLSQCLCYIQIGFKTGNS